MTPLIKRYSLEWSLEIFWLNSSNINMHKLVYSSPSTPIHLDKTAANNRSQDWLYSTDETNEDIS